MPKKHWENCVYTGIDLIGGPYIETDGAVCKAFRPPNAIRATS